MTRRLEEQQDALSHGQVQLRALEHAQRERADALRAAAAELAARRGEATGPIAGADLSEALRRKADAECRALEERSRRCGADWGLMH